MSTKVTVVLDDKLMKKQAKMIQNSTKNVSFSHVVIESLEKSL